MITILTPRTPAELRLEQIDEQLRLVENYAKGTAHALNAAMDVFWGTDDALLLDILNSKGPVEMDRIFTAHAINAANVNTLLAERGIEPIATIGMRKPIKLTKEGVFVMDYPPAPETPAEPEPPPEQPIDP